MKTLFAVIVFALAGHAFAEQTMLARVTAYWRSEGCGLRASWNGARLHNGHCAVDPKKIPFGSNVVFPDATCVAVDTGPDVVNRKAARSCARNAAQRTAIVIDRFFETKQQAMAWMGSHSSFVTVRVVRPNEIARTAKTTRPPARSTMIHEAALAANSRINGSCEIAEAGGLASSPRWARRRG